MIETPQLWLPERLRQRREDELLLRASGRGGVSRRWLPGMPCGCGGEEYPCDICRNGTMPDQIQVVLAGIANDGCTDCLPLNDTYVLERVYPETQPCRYDYAFDPNYDPGCAIDVTLLRFEFYNFGGSWSYRVIMNYTGLNAVTWQTSLTAGGDGKIDCTAVSGVVLSFFSDNGSAVDRCDCSSSTATVTSL